MQRIAFHAHGSSSSSWTVGQCVCMNMYHMDPHVILKHYIPGQPVLRCFIYTTSSKLEPMVVDYPAIGCYCIMHCDGRSGSCDIYRYSTGICDGDWGHHTGSHRWVSMSLHKVQVKILLVFVGYCKTRKFHLRLIFL